MSPVFKLYVKVWCPWCVAAEDWLRAHKYPYQQLDVESDPAHYAEMIRLTGQRRTPTLDAGHGLLLADFGPDELAAFVKKHGLLP